MASRNLAGNLAVIPGGSLFASYVLEGYAAAYDDVTLARATAALAEDWPAPRPYGRTLTLAAALARTAHEGPAARPTPARHGALYAQGLLHLQDLWCSRGGCGACPLSAPRADDPETGGPQLR